MIENDWNGHTRQLIETLEVSSSSYEKKMDEQKVCKMCVVHFVCCVRVLCRGTVQHNMVVWGVKEQTISRFNAVARTGHHEYAQMTARDLQKAVQHRTAGCQQPYHRLKSLPMQRAPDHFFQQTHVLPSGVGCNNSCDNVCLRCPLREKSCMVAASLLSRHE